MTTEEDKRKVTFYEAYFGFSAQIMIMASGRLLDWQSFGELPDQSQLVVDLLSKIDELDQIMDYRTVGFCAKKVLDFAEKFYMLNFFIDSNKSAEPIGADEILKKYQQVLL